MDPEYRDCVAQALARGWRKRGGARGRKSRFVGAASGTTRSGFSRFGGGAAGKGLGSLAEGLPSASRGRFKMDDMREEEGDGESAVSGSESRSSFSSFV